MTIMILFATFCAYLYIKAWIYTIQSYDSIWEMNRNFLQNIFTIPNTFSIAFLSVNLAIFIHIGLPLILIFVCSII